MCLRHSPRLGATQSEEMDGTANFCYLRGICWKNTNLFQLNPRTVIEVEHFTFVGPFVCLNVCLTLLWNAYPRV